MNDSYADPWEQRVSEACDGIWNALVDPREAYLDDDGLWWSPVAVAGDSRVAAGAAPLDEAQLADARAQCRRLVATNEFAINGIENRISYLVGPGHRYQANVRSGVDAPPGLAAQVQEVLDEFQLANRWPVRQQEIVRRLDRDGEAFLRFFVDDRGSTRVRFIEPEQVATPPELSRTPEASFGVHCESHDVETVLGYYVDGQPVPADEVQHRKANVDANVKRGLPLYFPVRKNLRRVEKLLRNMSALAEIQSAIALIRKHRGTMHSAVEQFADADARTRVAGGRTRRVVQYGPGTILDAPAGLEYDFPANGVQADGFLGVLQAELRAIAARLVMPEFMFTSDASNANYSSTLVAEGPAVKMFERLQATLKGDDAEVMTRVVDNAVRAGRLPLQTRRFVEIQIGLPSLHVRDQLRECQVEKMAYDKGILSPQTWSQRMGLDYEQEQKNLAMHRETS